MSITHLPSMNTHIIVAGEREHLAGARWYTNSVSTRREVKFLPVLE